MAAKNRSKNFNLNILLCFFIPASKNTIPNKPIQIKIEPQYSKNIYITRFTYLINSVWAKQHLLFLNQTMHESSYKPPSLFLQNK